MPDEAHGGIFQHRSRQEILRFEEIVRLTRVFVQLGVRKIRLTGGEPLLRKHLDQLIAQLAEIVGVEDIALTTNGYLLARQAQSLKAAGLKRITVSLDALDEQLFREMVGRDYQVSKVLDGLDAARQAGFSPIKINMVVRRGKNEDQVIDMLHHFRGSGHIVRFIEYMDVGNCNDWSAEQVVSSSELLERISSHWPIEPLEPTKPGEVASRWRFCDRAGEIGFISSVSSPFCSDCNRARLSADGKLYLCLFATSGHDLKSALREGVSDETLAEMISSIWQQRTDNYSEQRFELRRKDAQTAKVEMFQIGG